MGETMPPNTMSHAQDPLWMQTIKSQVAFDQNSTRREYQFPLPKAVHDIMDPDLADKRDAMMLDLKFNITCVLFPSIAFQFWMPTALSGWATYFGLFHLFLVYFFYTQRFILMLHYSEHKRLFKPSSNLTVLHGLCPYVLAPIFGIPPGCYRLHHVVMHHLEDNMFPEDLSSTMPYQRDNFLHFLHYWGKFFFCIHFELPYYAFKSRRYDMFAQNIICHSLWIGAIYYLYGINPTATLFTAILPFCVTSVLLMWGNWCQHMFVDPKRPTDDHALTYNCINHIENLYTFNDGYHIVHHINSRVHWSDMPQRFLDELPTYADKGAICFNNLHFMQVGVLVMTGQWSALYDAYIQLSDEPKSEKEVVEMMKRRLAPCAVPNKQQKSA